MKKYEIGDRVYVRVVRDLYLEYRVIGDDGGRLISARNGSGVHILERHKLLDTAPSCVEVRR